MDIPGKGSVHSCALLSKWVLGVGGCRCKNPDEIITTYEKRRAGVHHFLDLMVDGHIWHVVDDEHHYTFYTEDPDLAKEFGFVEQEDINDE